MTLKEQIITERITRLEQLDAAQREQIRADEELAKLLEENRLLCRARPAKHAAPELTYMLGRVYDRADNYKEHPMTLITRFLSGRRWYVQAALAVVLLAVLAAFAAVFNVATRTPSWASADGYMLVFDFGPLGGGDLEAAAHAKLDKLHEALAEWRELQPEGEGEYQNQLRLMINIDNDSLIASVSLVDPDPQRFEELKSVLAAADGLPEPQVTDATWFSDPKAGGPGSGVEVRLLDHLFSFPEGTPPEEMEEQINAWLAENMPGCECTVEVETETVMENGKAQEKKRIEIKIATPEDEE